LTWTGFWDCSPGKNPCLGKAQEGQKITRPGLWVQENPGLGSADL